MGVKTVSGNDDEEVEEAENIIDRELLNFWYLYIYSWFSYISTVMQSFINFT